MFLFQEASLLKFVQSVENKTWGMALGVGATDVEKEKKKVGSKCSCPVRFYGSVTTPHPL